MEELIDVQKYCDDTNKLNQLIKSYLIDGHTKKCPILNSNLHILIIDELNILFASINAQFLLSNNFVRNILIYGDIPIFFQKEIIIYLGSDYEIFLSQHINNLAEILKSRQIAVQIKEKNILKFKLKIANKDFSFVVKERDKMSNYNSFFELNQLEYDIKNNLFSNKLSNKTYVKDDSHLINIKKMNLFPILSADFEDKLMSILEQTQNNPLIIFELIELVISFPNFFNVLEVNNFLINLNTLIKTKKDFTKHIQNVCNNDDELNFYKKIIQFAYDLEENGTYHIYVKYIVHHYDVFVNIVTGIKIDKEIFELFDNYNFRDFICYLIYQHLVYKNRKLFKIIKHVEKTEIDLLDIFMNGNHSKKNLDTKNIYIESSNDVTNKTNENNEIIDEISLLDKYKFKSLKHLKEITKTFIKFEDLIKMVPISQIDQIHIKQFYNLNMLLYGELTDIRKHHALKLAYIAKRFHFASKEVLVKSVVIFNYLINRRGYDKFFIIHNDFINIVTSKILNDYIFGKMINIPKIKTNFENNTDCINITDYQDAFILFIEFIYKNKKNYSEDESNLIDFFDSVFESGVCDIRAYRLFKNDTRRKKEKKLKKIKKEQKEQKKSKYKIVKNNMLNNLSETCSDINENIEVDENKQEKFASDHDNSKITSEFVNISKITFGNSDTDTDTDTNTESDTNINNYSNNDNDNDNSNYNSNNIDDNNVEENIKIEVNTEDSFDVDDLKNYLNDDLFSEVNDANDI